MHSECEYSIMHKEQWLVCEEYQNESKKWFVVCVCVDAEIIKHPIYLTD